MMGFIYRYIQIFKGSCWPIEPPNRTCSLRLPFIPLATGRLLHSLRVALTVRLAATSAAPMAYFDRHESGKPNCKATIFGGIPSIKLVILILGIVYYYYHYYYYYLVYHITSCIRCRNARSNPKIVGGKPIVFCGVPPAWACQRKCGVAQVRKEF